MTLRARNRWRIGLTAVAAVILAVGVTSCFVDALVERVSVAGFRTGWNVARGAVYIRHENRNALKGLPGANKLAMPGWKFDPQPVAGPPLVELLPRWSQDGSESLMPGWSLRLPLWMPLAIIGFPAAWLWWRRLHPPAHACSACGYDLRGLRGGVCPECGRTTVAGTK